MLLRAPLARRRGHTVILVAVCLLPILGVTAIVIDGGILLSDRRQAQRAADSAALAAATDLFTKWTQNAGADSNGIAVRSARTTAAANGYADDGTNSTVTVNVPPQSGTFAGQAGYAEVIIGYNQQRLFSGIWSSAKLPVSARAVARGLWTPASPGILVLDPTGNNALDVSASGNVTVTNGGAVIVDSNSASGGATFGDTGSVVATAINLGDNTYNHSSSGTLYAPAVGLTSGINYNQLPTPDPLAALPEPSRPALPPTPPTMTGQTYSTDDGVNFSGTGTLDLYPGSYAGITSTGSGSILLHANPDGSPGIYYLGSQGLSITNVGSLTGSNVMIYSNGQGNVSLTGSGALNLSPPTSGTYQGITLFQERSSNKQINVSGQGNVNLSGTFYAAAAKVSITGSGNYTNTIGSQWIAGQLAVTGQGSFTVNYNGQATPKRTIQLVE
jgi:Putative Flp pilus-assembly TadE/G-like